MIRLLWPAPATTTSAVVIVASSPSSRSALPAEDSASASAPRPGRATVAAGSRVAHVERVVGAEQHVVGAGELDQRAQQRRRRG